MTILQPPPINGGTDGERRVVWNLLHYLEEKGFKVISVGGGEERTKISDLKIAMEVIFSVDMSWVYVCKGTTYYCIVIALGNSPEEVICDHSSPPNDSEGFLVAMDAFNAEEYV